MLILESVGRCGATARPSGRSSPVSSKRTTPLHRRLHPCSGWNAIVCAASRSASSAEGQGGLWGHIFVPFGETLSCCPSFLLLRPLCTLVGQGTEKCRCRWRKAGWSDRLAFGRTGYTARLPVRLRVVAWRPRSVVARHDDTFLAPFPGVLVVPTAASAGAGRRRSGATAEDTGAPRPRVSRGGYELPPELVGTAGGRAVSRDMWTR
jgi:hypothetical protein